MYSVKGAKPRYFESFFAMLKISFIVKETTKSYLFDKIEKKNTKIGRINQKGTRMVKDEED